MWLGGGGAAVEYRYRAFKPGVNVRSQYVRYHGIYRDLGRRWTAVRNDFQTEIRINRRQSVRVIHPRAAIIMTVTYARNDDGSGGGGGGWYI